MFYFIFFKELLVEGFIILDPLKVNSSSEELYSSSFSSEDANSALMLDSSELFN